jgi:hypothetical protein
MNTTMRLTGVAAALAVCTMLAGCPNLEPTETSAQITTTEDTASAPVTPKVVDPNPDDKFTFEIVGAPNNGSAAVVAGQLVYTPDPDFNGNDSFVYRAIDRGGLSVDGIAKVTVTPVNDAPTATGGGRAMFIGSAGSRTPWVDDVDLFDTATLQILTAPSLGTVVANGARWTYTPLGTATGPDSFTYSVTDSGGASVSGPGRVRLYDATALNECTRDSTVNPTTGVLGPRTRSNACAFYSSIPSRTRADGSNITVDYFSTRPSADVAPKGIVIAIGGGDFNMNLSGNSATGVADTTGGGNYVVRSAQQFSQAGYSVLALDRPSDLPTAGTTDTVADADAYRLSPRHAVDLVQLLKRVNTQNLPVFLLGTSRGAMSVVAQNRLATAIAFTSGVTSDANPSHVYVGKPGVTELQPAFVKRPTFIGWHQDDLCPVSTPAGSQAIASAFGAAGVAVTTSVMAGGVRITAVSGTPTSPVNPDVCGPYDYHGYLGIENAAANAFTAWLDARIAAAGANHPPAVTFASFTAAPATARKIDLSRLARDADGDTLGFSLTHATSVLGGSLAISGNAVTYTPPAGVVQRDDQFVYIVEDGKGGVAAAVITMRIGG